MDIFNKIMDTLRVTGKVYKVKDGMDWSNRKRLTMSGNPSKEEVEAWKEIERIESKYKNMIDISYEDRAKIIKLKEILEDKL